MNPTHYPYPAALIAAAERYYGTRYRAYSVTRDKSNRINYYHYRPRQKGCPPLTIKQTLGEGCQIVMNQADHRPRDCNTWCCVVAAMVEINRLEAM